MNTINEFDCNETCLEGLEDRTPTGIILVALVSCLLLIFLSMLIRFYLWHRKIMKRDIKIIMHKGRITYESDAFSMKITRLSLILILLGCDVKACIDPSRIIQQKNVFSVSASEGESLCFKDGSVELLKVRVQHPVHFMYRTGEWKHQAKFDWYCSSGQCPSVSDCNSMDGSISLGKETLIRTTCRSFIRGCAFGFGCWKGFSRVTLSANLVVYRVATGVQRLTLSQHMIDCKAEMAGLSPSPKWQYLVLGGDVPRLCELASDRGRPQTGILGDAQASNGSLLFNWDSIKCVQDWYWNGTCSESHPTFANCLPLPAVLDGVQYDFSHGYLVSRPVQSQFIQLQCNSTRLKPYVRTTTVPSLKIVGKRGSDQGILLMATCHSKGADESALLAANCSSVRPFRVLCDSQDHYFPISDLDECSILDLSTNDTLDYLDVSTSSLAATLLSFDEYAWRVLPHLGWTTLAIVFLLVLVLIRH